MNFSTKSIKILFLFIGFISFIDSSFSSKKNAYPGIQKLSCLTQPHLINHSVEYKKGVKKAKEALEKKYDSPESVWSQEILKKNARLRFVIEDYLAGKRGQSVRKLMLKGKKAEDLHKELTESGFYHKRLPLLASGSASKENGKFWRRDGTKTSDLNESQLVPIDIYCHPDGGLVRVKPEGIPSQKYPRPEPDAVKAVVYELKLITDKATQQEILDTRFRNEAFKVSETGAPLPKAVGFKHGLRLLFTRHQIKESDNPEAAKIEQKGWIDTIMSEVHIDLISDFSHCTPEIISENKK